LNRLGPTYVKLGQTLATRPDIVGDEVAADLAVLQDKMDPFDDKLVPTLLADALGDRARRSSQISRRRSRLPPSRRCTRPPSPPRPAGARWR
jgi:ubiquinone biosynthesis protein